MIRAHDLHKSFKTRTATVLQGRFATLCTVQQALDRAAA